MDTEEIKKYYTARQERMREASDALRSLEKEVREEYLRLKYTAFYWFFNSIGTYLQASEYIGTHRCIEMLDFIIEKPFTWEGVHIRPEPDRAFFCFASDCYCPRIIRNAGDLEVFKAFRKAQIGGFKEKFVDKTPNNYVLSLSGVDHEKFAKFKSLLEENGKSFCDEGFIGVVQYSYEKGYIKMDTLSETMKKEVIEILNC